MKRTRFDNLDFVEALEASGWFFGGSPIPGVSVFVPAAAPCDTDKQAGGADGGAAPPAPASAAGADGVASPPPAA